MSTEQPSRATRPAAEDSARLARALASPLRYRILLAMTEHDHSPRELAEAFGETVSLVAYHVRILRETGAIELVHERRRRGATEHFYRACGPAAFARTETLQLDSEASEEMAELLEEVHSRALEIQAGSERRGHGNGRGKRPRSELLIVHMGRGPEA